MKTNKQTITIRTVAVILLMMLALGQAYSQTYKRKTPVYFGGGLETFSSGNWHGAFYSPYLNVTKGRKSFSGGPIFQKRSMELSGGKLSYSYNLSGTKKHKIDYDEEEEELGNIAGDYAKTPDRQLLQLNCFGFTQYVHETSLSYAAQKTEEQVEHSMVEMKENQSARDWNKVRLSTIEIGVGFELYVKLTKRISWKSYVAGAAYYHVNYINGMYHERVSPSLVLGTGIHICPL
ncbi:MAG: hypothetical protein K0S32_69 [Bacteroidetes bacterium]|jgi:hypothetical protein|nr:hypothetical protein [Bacteroidota bacterium]